MWQLSDKKFWWSKLPVFEQKIQLSIVEKEKCTKKDCFTSTNRSLWKTRAQFFFCLDIFIFFQTFFLSAILIALILFRPAKIFSGHTYDVFTAFCRGNLLKSSSNYVIHVIKIVTIIDKLDNSIIKIIFTIDKGKFLVFFLFVSQKIHLSLGNLIFVVFFSKFTPWN